MLMKITFPTRIWMALPSTDASPEFSFSKNCVFVWRSLNENLKQYAQNHRNMLKPFVESGRLKFLIPEEKEIFNNI